MTVDIPISPAGYFNQRLLNFNRYFASDVDYIFLARSVYEQHHLRSSINFAMHKIKPSALTAGTTMKCVLTHQKIKLMISGETI